MVTVITITYNRKNFLAKAIQSVLDQTYGDFEYLIVDDGSTDGSDLLVQNFDDKRIKYIYSEHLGYISKLKNIALEQAKGDIVAFLDSDDLWDQTNLEKIVSVFEKQSANSVVSNAYIVEKGLRTALFRNEKSFSLSGNLLEQKLLNQNFILCTCCFSFRRKILTFNYNENLKAGDTDFFLQILSIGNTIVLLEKLALINKHADSMTANVAYDSPFIQAYLEDLATFEVLKSRGSISAYTYKKATSSHLYKLANNLARIHRKQDAKRNFLKAFIIFPPHLMALVKYFYFLIY